ncbi:hypothetical protein EKG37_06650 [Robertmurraya yapensis]|uniref:GK1464-like domain-containing protein n=2 Tax=Bacillaceae TaxID=186817 RepID=A0A431WEA9_9BACI|nr:DUF5634 family protein [Bacillus yapensis]RTR33894.1 hypothetical protein EKG37_06650 [Bacillus yapensis]TKS97212.1 hypothetical protein FAR12_06650 [Bacillus yapensis]
MEYLTREQIIHDLQEPLQSYIDQFGIDDIGIFEEQGQDALYYMGYTVNKDGKTYHIHTPFQKNEQNEFTPVKNEWTLETDEPDSKDKSGYYDVESVLKELH